MQNCLKKGHQNHETKHGKSDFVQSTTYNKLCKKCKIIDILKNAFKNDIEIVKKKRENTHFVETSPV